MCLKALMQVRDTLYDADDQWAICYRPTAECGEDFFDCCSLFNRMCGNVCRRALRHSDLTKIGVQRTAVGPVAELVERRKIFTFGIYNEIVRYE